MLQYYFIFILCAAMFSYFTFVFDLLSICSVRFHHLASPVLDGPIFDPVFKIKMGEEFPDRFDGCVGEHTREVRESKEKR